jgi:hypothetical protein
MAEVLRPQEDHSTARGTNSFLAVMALVIAVAALVLAWAAYNRAGEDLENQIGQGIEQTAEQAGEAVQEGTDSVEQAVDEGPDGVDDGAR